MRHHVTAHAPGLFARPNHLRGSTRRYLDDGETWDFPTLSCFSSYVGPRIAVRKRLLFLPLYVIILLFFDFGVAAMAQLKLFGSARGARGTKRGKKRKNRPGRKKAAQGAGHRADRSALPRGALFPLHLFEHPIHRQIPHHLHQHRNEHHAAPVARDVLHPGQRDRQGAL